MPVIDVTDATFQTEVIERSASVPVVVDLWATWCGPCQTLGPIIEKVVDETAGKVVLVKVDVDANPGISQAFQVQSIPLVVAIADGRPVDAFQGALGENEVREFVQRLLPSGDQQQVLDLIAAGDEPSLRLALQLEPGNEAAVLALARILIDRGDNDEALGLLERIPENEESRQLAARARLGDQPADDHDHTLNDLLGRVKGDDDARQQFVDILELMGPADPRTAKYRKLLTAELF